ncbi:MAG: hypothetical protein ACXV8R_09475 [Acidimicrobiia bacterium]
MHVASHGAELQLHHAWSADDRRHQLVFVVVTGAGRAGADVTGLGAGLAVTGRGALDATGRLAALELPALEVPELGAGPDGAATGT